MTQQVVNGNTYTDDGTNRYLNNGGHRTWWFPLLQDLIAVVATATQAPGTSGNSTTSLAIGTGAKSLTIETGKSIPLGAHILCAYNTDPTQYMHGVVTSYNSGNGALAFTSQRTAGSGTYAAWTVSITGPAMVIGTLSNEAVSGVKSFTYYAEYDNGNSGVAKTIDLANGQKQKVTLSANTTLTISNAPGVGHYQLRLIQDATGSRTVTWSGLNASRWLGSASAPAINAAANGETIVNIFYDGANFTQSLAKVGAV